MKKLQLFSVLLLAAVLVAGCDSKDKPDTSVAKAPPKKNKPTPAADGVVAENGADNAGQGSIMPTEGSANAGKVAEGGNVDFSSLSKKVKDTGTLGMPGFSDVDVLNRALASFYASHKEPLTSLQQLVDAKLIRNVPVPPPGKKYVIDARLRQVNLRDK